MTRSQRIPVNARSFVALAVVVLVGGACGREPRDAATTGSTASAVTSSPSAIAACNPPAAVRGMERDRFIAWARGLGYHAPDPARGRASDFDASANVQVHAAQGMDTVPRADLARGCVIARIISQAADAAFGIKADTAYVWADSTNPFTATIVPDDGSAGVTYNMDVLDTGGTPPTVTAVPKHICSECGRTDWCVYPRDEIRLTDEAVIGRGPGPETAGSALALRSPP